MCRVRYLREYFADDPREDCGHCDNCLSRMAVRAVVPGRARRRRAPRRPDVSARPAGEPSLPRFTVGDRVRHARFGEGAVEAVADQNITVRCMRSGLKKVRAELLRLLEPSAATAIQSPA